MSFDEILNNYIETIGCTASKLASVSKISPSTLSRYRKGDRIPKYQSKELENLINGLSKLAKEKNVKNLNKKIISENLNKTLDDEIDYETFKNNLNIIIKELKINVAELSRFTGFDASYLSKVRSGLRKPQNISEFSNSICKYISNKYNDSISKEIIISLTKCNEEDLNEKEKYINTLNKWISNNIKKEDHIIDNFLTNLDNFDLNEYIKTIKFDKLKVPTMPITIQKSKTYYGLKGFKESQLDVLKSIVLSKSKEDVFFYSNMSMVEASKDLEFTKKFMFGLAMMLKKGLHLNIIHDLDRPFKELMLGLEGWIPLYMTGQISPYYFKNNSNLLYSNIECCGGSAILSGSYITGNIKNARFYFSSKKDDVEFYRQNSKLLLKKANSLMDIYNSNNEQEFNKFLNKNIDGNQKNILCNLPLYTITDKLLNKLLDRNKISNNDKKLIIKTVKNEKERINKILDKNKIINELIILSKEEFQNSNYSLPLSQIFYNQKIIYTYEDYLEHIKLTKNFKHKNYSYKINNNNIFKNINIYIIENKTVIISKENAPAIHFVIHHPTLVDAISNFEVPIVEK